MLSHAAASHFSHTSYIYSMAANKAPTTTTSGSGSGSSSLNTSLGLPYYASQEIMMPLEMEATGNIPVATSNNDNFVPAAAAAAAETGHNKNNGVFLTWEDLWVVVSGGKNGAGSGGARAILRGLTGYARPGELLAIMGPSGCGKSTLLDALAGRLNSNTRQSGDILVNGLKQPLAYGTSAYVTQDDALIATLTVREAVYYSAHLQLPGSMSKSEKKERAETTIREMGLQEASDTRIGGWGAKGLSGGQKRRVSICIEILTRPNLLFLDEPTSGLDSAASYYVMSRIARLDQREQPRTIIASIHQPSSEVFALFHNLCLLSSGRTVYFGPAAEANQFFALNGLPCPTFQNQSDHFLKTINKDFEEDIENGRSSERKTTEEVIDMLVSSYKSSDNYQTVGRHVAEICQQTNNALEKSRSNSGFLTQCYILTRRSSVNMFRDLGYYWMRLAIYIAICLGLGTVFYDVNSSPDSVRNKGSMLMFVVSFLTFMAIGGFPSFVEDMKVFERERLNGHYGCAAFAIANTLSSVPYLFLTSLIPGAIAYYLVGLQRGFEHFVYFTFVLFACMILVESLMMIIASIVPSYLMGIIAGAGLQGLMILAGGFFRLPSDLPKLFWKYPMYYIAFHNYAYQGLFKNEIEQEIYRNRSQIEMGYSKWVNLGILLGMSALFRVMFLMIIKSQEKVKPVIRALISISHKQAAQVMMNPTATPSHY